MSYTAATLSSAEDRARLLALWSGAMTDPAIGRAGAARLSWLFGENPAGPPICCVTNHVESDTFIACGLAYPRNMTVDGSVRAAGILADFVVDRAHRTAGPALAVQRRLMNESLERFGFIYGYPNKNAKPIFKRLGYETVATTVSFSRPLRTAQVMSKYLRHPVAARVAGACVDAALRATDLRVLAHGPWRYRDEVLDRADHRFDDLWHRARGHYAITGERTASYLNWRYADFKTAHHRFHCVSRRRSGDLIGFVAFSIKDDVIIVDDVFCDDPRTTFGVVLSRFTAAMHGGPHRSIYLSLVAEPWYEQVLTRLLYFKRPGERSLVVRAAPGAAPELVGEVMNRNRWYMFAGELDI